MVDFNKPFFVLAPLAGWTDLPFRATVKKFGADFTISEMISANALVHNSQRTQTMIAKSSNENPYSVQIAGSNSAIIKESVKVLNDIEGIDCIDLNCGCPAPKVFGHGSGSKLLDNIPLLANLLETIKANSNKAFTSVKIRLGVNEDKGVEVAKACEQSGVDFIAVHGRTRKQRFKGYADHQSIARIKASVKVPVIANGDIDSFQKALEVLSITKANGLMIGRGAMGKPWIFRQLKDNVATISLQEKKAIILEHFDNMIEFYGQRGNVLFRKHLHSYTKGLQQASRFRDEINRIEEPKIARERIEALFDIQKV